MVVSGDAALRATIAVAFLHERSGRVGVCVRKEKIRQVFWSVTEIRASMTFRLARIPASPCGFPRGFNKLDGLKAVLYRGLAGLVRGVIATLARSHSANPDLDVHGGASDC